MFEHHLEHIVGSSADKGQDILMNGAKLTAHATIKSLYITGPLKERMKRIFTKPCKTTIPTSSLETFSKLAKNENVEFLVGNNKVNKDKSVIIFHKEDSKKIHNALSKLIKDKTTDKTEFVDEKKQNDKEPEITIEDAVLKKVNRRFARTKRECEIVKAEIISNLEKTKTKSKESNIDVGR